MEILTAYPYLASLIPAAVCLLLLCLSARSAGLAAKLRGRHLPPGPTPLPVIGNLFDIPKVTPWRRYAELCKKYGNMIHLRVLGQSIVIINDAHIAANLLEKRSAIYSSRPQSNMVALTGWQWNISLMPYGHSWRRHRRVLWQHFHPGIVHRYHSVQHAGVRRLLTKLLDSLPGDDLNAHVTYVVGTSVLKATYGLDITRSDDSYMALVEEGVASGEFLLAGASILEYFPFLARIPTWVPGARLLKLGKLAEIREAVRKLRTSIWDAAKQNLNLVTTNMNMNTDGDEHEESITSAIVAELAHRDAAAAAEEEEVAKNITGALYVAAVDTTSVTLCAFLVAMSLNEDVQKKAQAELDAVVGPNRLPELGDRDALPYVEAIIKETLRWHSAVPLGLPHVSTADDEYEGYFIPKGTLVMCNAWEMLNDSETYSEPEKFMPERFLKDGRLNPDVKDPSTLVFGFGRRICPGRHFANVSLFLNISAMLHTLCIKPGLDEHGEPIRTRPEASTTIVSRMEDCKCTIRPRSDRAETLIRS